MLLKSKELDELWKQEQELMKEIEDMEYSSEREEKELVLEKKRLERMNKIKEVAHKQREEQKKKNNKYYTSKSIMTYKDLRKVLKRKYENRKELRREIDNFLNELREELKKGREFSKRIEGKKDLIKKEDVKLKHDIMKW